MQKLSIDSSHVACFFDGLDVTDFILSLDNILQFLQVSTKNYCKRRSSYRLFFLFSLFKMEP
ncbi:hypothetical protein WDU94_001195 [Cyamophila willieti]